MQNFDKWLTWAKPKAEQGLLVAASVEQEWMLPWWWYNYSLHNQYPVSFVDFGLSEKGKEWCREKGELISCLDIPDSFVAQEAQITRPLLKKWKKNFGACPSFRKFWFKKPLAMLRSPYQKTIWLDLDCEIRCSLNPLFKKLLKTDKTEKNKKTEIGLCRVSTVVQKNHRQLKLLKSKELVYNSGLILFFNGSSIIHEWALRALDSSHLFFGDQDLLSYLIFKHKYQVLDLPEIYNWLHYQTYNPEVKILHYGGTIGKDLIHKKMKKLSQVAFVDFS